jgi:hypothetical protein
VTGPAPVHMERRRLLEVTPQDDGTFAFRATLTDESFGGNYAAGGDSIVVHDFIVVGRVTRELEVLELVAEAPTHPYDLCPRALAACTALVGGSLQSGWRRKVLGVGGGTAGCTHLTSLLLSLTELTTLSFFLQINEHLPYDRKSRSTGAWMAVGLGLAPQLGDACHVLTRDGEVLTAARALPDPVVRRPGTATSR